MRLLTTLPLLGVLAAFAAADDKPLTKAEHDALAKAIKEKANKAQKDKTAADKGVAEAQKGVRGERALGTAYTAARLKLNKVNDDLAAATGTDEAATRRRAELEQARKDAAVSVEEAFKGLADKLPDEAKAFAKALDDRDAALKAVKDAEAERVKLGPPPVK